MDSDRPLSRLRALLYSPPSRQGWDALCALFDDWRGDDLEVGLRYAEGLLDAWPDALRRAPFRWAEPLRTFDERLAPQEAPPPPPAWSLVRALTVDTSNIQDDAFDALLVSPYLAPVTALTLGTDPRGRPWSMTSEMLIALTRSPRMGQLRALNLSFNRIDSLGVEALAACPQAAGLLHLDLSCNEIDDRGAVAVATSPHLTSLSTLDLSRNPLTAAGHDALLQSQILGDAIKEALRARLDRRR